MAHRYNLLLASVFLTIGAHAQTTTLTGVVAVQNSAYETGTRKYIPDAAIRAAFAKAEVSDAQGHFNLQFAGLGAGVPVRVSATKPGWEVVNAREMDAVIPGQLAQLIIVMADPQKLADAQGAYYGIAVESIKQGYEKKLAALTNSTSTAEQRLAVAGDLYGKEFATMQQAMEAIAVERDAAINSALELAHQFAVVDLDNASALYISAFEKFRSGKVDIALTILDRDRLDGDYRSAVKQMEKGRAMIAKAGAGIRQVFDSYQLKANVYLTKLDNRSALGVYSDMQRILKENTELFDTRTEVKLLLDVAEAKERTLDFTGALASVQQAIALVESSFGKDHPLSAGAYLEWGELLTNQGDFPNAMAQFEKVLSLNTPEAPIDSLVWADALGNLGLIHTQMGAPAKALEFYNSDIALRQNLFDEKDPDLALCYGNLAAAQVSLQDVNGANANFQKAINALSASDDPRMGFVLANYGSLLRATGNHAAAIDTYRSASGIITKYYGLDEFNQVNLYSNIAATCGDIGRVQEGLLAVDTAITVGDRLLGPEHPNMLTVHTTRASLLSLAARFDEAMKEYEWSLSANTKLFGPDNYTNGVIYNGMAKVYQSRGDYTGALAQLDKAVPIIAASLGQQHPNVMVVNINRGCIQTYAGGHATAITTLNATIPELIKITGPDHATIGKGKGCLGTALFNAGDPAAAKPELLESARIVPETQTSWYLYQVAVSEKDDAVALDRLVTCARQRAKAKFEDPLLVKKETVKKALVELATHMGRKDVLEEFAVY